MPTNVYRGATKAIAQQVTATPAVVEVGDTFTLTVTMDDGSTAAVSFVATVATVANVTAGLAAAWNASGASELQYITATDATTHVLLASNVPGRPFTVAGSTANGGAANTQTLTVTTTVANSGPYDVGLAANWSLGALPTASDDVRVPPNAPAMLYNLGAFYNQSLNSFVVEDANNSIIGRAEDGRLYSLKVLLGNGKLCEIRGRSNFIAIDLQASQVSPVVETDGSPSTMPWAVNLIGSALVTVDQRSGVLALAGFPGQTATVTGSILVASGTCVVGEGVTVSGVTARVLGSTGRLVSYVSIPTVHAEPNSTFEQARGNWTTLNVHDGATIYADAGGTYATLNVYGPATFDTTRTLIAKVVSTANIYSSEAVLKEIKGLVTWTALNPYYAMSN